MREKKFLRLNQRDVFSRLWDPLGCGPLGYGTSPLGCGSLGYANFLIHLSTWWGRKKKIYVIVSVLGPNILSIVDASLR